MYDIKIDDCECACKAFEIVDKTFPWFTIISGFIILAILLTLIYYYFYYKPKKQQEKYVTIKVR